MLTGFALLWFLMALGCILAGSALTRGRADVPPPVSRVPPRRQRAQRDGGKPMILRARRLPVDKIECDKSICPRCTRPVEKEERFCGACGLFIVYPTSA